MNNLGGLVRLIIADAMCRAGLNFFTVVTERRASILANEMARDCLRSAIRHCQHGLPFHVDALVILPLCPLGMTISTPFGLCRPAIAIIPNAGALS